MHGTVTIATALKLLPAGSDGHWRMSTTVHYTYATKTKNVAVKTMTKFLPYLTVFWKQEQTWKRIQVIKGPFAICQRFIYNVKQHERESRSESGPFLFLVHLCSLAPASKGESPHFQESSFFNGQSGPGNQWMSSLFRAPPRWTFLSFIFTDRGVPNLYLFHSEVITWMPGAPPRWGVTTKRGVGDIEVKDKVGCFSFAFDERRRQKNQRKNEWPFPFLLLTITFHIKMFISNIINFHYRA